MGHRKCSTLLLHPWEGCEEYGSQRVCVYVCLLIYLKKPYVQSSQNFLYEFPTTAMAQSISDDSAIHYVLLFFVSCNLFSLLIYLRFCCYVVNKYTVT